MVGVAVVPGVMLRVLIAHIVVMVRGRACRVRVAQDHGEPAVDVAQHVSRGNEGPKAKQREHQRGRPRTYPTMSQATPVRSHSASADHRGKMPQRQVMDQVCAVT